MKWNTLSCCRCKSDRTIFATSSRLVSSFIYLFPPPSLNIFLRCEYFEHYWKVYLHAAEPFARSWWWNVLLACKWTFKFTKVVVSPSPPVGIRILCETLQKAQGKQLRQSGYWFMSLIKSFITALLFAGLMRNISEISPCLCCSQQETETSLPQAPLVL